MGSTVCVKSCPTENSFDTAAQSTPNNPADLECAPTHWMNGDCGQDLDDGTTPGSTFTYATAA